MGHPAGEREREEMICSTDSNSWHCKDIACAKPTRWAVTFYFFIVTDVEIKRGWAEWHAPATRCCAGRQTSVQWHPPHEYLVGAHAGDRGCHCSLWSQPSWVNLADREYKHIYTEILDIYLSVYSSAIAVPERLWHTVRKRAALIRSTY